MNNFNEIVEKDILNNSVVLFKLFKNNDNKTNGLSILLSNGSRIVVQPYTEDEISVSVGSPPSYESYLTDPTISEYQKDIIKTYIKKNIPVIEYLKDLQK